MSKGLKKVAVVGGGVAGLLSLRHILKYPHLKPTLFEATDNVGGVWVYDGKKNQYEDYDHQTTPVSIYRNLVCNQSKQIMEFPDFKHKDTKIPTLLHHKYVLDYLQQFACKFQLKRHTLLKHRVEKITPLIDKMGDTQHWKIQVRNQTEMTSQLFDAIVVCNGHFTKPNIPEIQGFEYFRGRALHSRYYRHPEDFYDKRVIIIGANVSALDIALDIAEGSAMNIYVSNRGKPITSQLPPQIHEVPEVSHFSNDGHSVNFVNGGTISVDAVIFATGFLYEYPFLDENCGIEVTKKNRVTPLFNHIVNIQHPSMLFVGIPNWTPLFQMLYFQAVYISKLLADEIKLPAANIMLMAESHDYMSRIIQGWPPHKAHSMDGISLQYLNYLADMSGVDRMPNCLKNIYNHVIKTRARDVVSFKHDTYLQEDFDD